MPPLSKRHGSAPKAAAFTSGKLRCANHAASATGTGVKERRWCNQRDRDAPQTSLTEASVGLGLDQTGGRRLDGGLGARRRAKLDLGIINVKIDRPLHQAEL